MALSKIKTSVEAEGARHYSKSIFYLYCFSCEGMLLCCNMYCPVGSWMGRYGCSKDAVTSEGLLFDSKGILHCVLRNTIFILWMSTSIF